MHVPKSIHCVRINPKLCTSELFKGARLPFDTIQPADSASVIGDVDIFANSIDHAVIQVEGLQCVPFSKATNKADKEMFSTTIWDVAGPEAELIAEDERTTMKDVELSHHLERIAVFYLRVLDQEVSKDHPSRREGQYASFTSLPPTFSH